MRQLHPHEKRDMLLALAGSLLTLLIGYVFILASASSPSVAVEAEQAQPDMQAKIVADSSASQGKALQFNQESATTPTAIKKVVPGISWQWQLTDTINENILDAASPPKLYDIDLYDTPAATITRLKAKGIAVICYFSAGSAENWRPDYANFPANVKGKALDGWEGETWLDVRQLTTLKTIMGARMDLATQKGCEGVEPDNIDGYTNTTGFPLTAADQLAYNRMLAAEAHKRGLSIGLKNDVDQISQLVSDFDWALNEQCYQYNECGAYKAFIDQGKAVLGVEYQGTPDTFCPKANAANFDWLKKDLQLGATPRVPCRGK